jgi:uncharacterized membrane protein
MPQYLIVLGFSEGEDFNVIRLDRELHLVIILTLSLAGIAALGEGGWDWLQYIRVSLTVICLLFFPGYAVICALFPGKDDLGQLERIVLSFAFSMIIVPLIGFVLNFTPWGVQLLSCLISISFFIILMAIVAMYRRHQLSPQVQYMPFLELELSSFKQLPAQDKMMALMVVLAIVVTAASCSYFIASSQGGERYTEFYILNENGLAGNFPQELEAGKAEKLIVGIVNHQQKEVTYSLNIEMQNIIKSTKGPLLLRDGEKWEETVEISANYPHEKLKVEFLLYRNGESEPYRVLHLWVTVK